MTFIPHTIRHGSHPIPAIGPATVSDLHYRLGKLVEHYPGRFVREGGDNTHNTNRHYFEEIEPVRSVDHGALDRLDAIAAEAREMMGEARWAALQAEWFPKETKNVG